MVPTRIIEIAAQRGLHGIAITDHNTAENVDSVRRAAAGKDLEVMGGMEITSAEEIHVIALFGEDEALCTMQDLVYASLPGLNDHEAFGRQWIVDHEDGVIGENRKLLIGATTLSIDRIVDEIHMLGGLAIASHVDRPVFSVVSQLGFIPDGLALDAVEVSPQYRGALTEVATAGRQIVSSSDAHAPEEIGQKFTSLIAEAVSVEEIRKAITGIEGRRLVA
jgi:predicted metal-dependent phosphoesterase TrpH